MFEGMQQVGCGYGVVYDQWDVMVMCDFGYGGDVGDVVQWIVDGFDEDGFGVFIDQWCKGFWLVWIGEVCLDVELWQCVGEEVVGIVIQGGG